MPQLNQLSDVILSQLFWLAIVLGFIYFVIGRGMVPKIQSTVDARDRRIADNLAAAERARAEADETEQAYRLRMDESRADALKHTIAAKKKGAMETEKQIAEADAAIQSKLGDAEARIGASRDAAAANIESLAAELVQDIASKVANMSVDRADAVKALRAAHANG